jgi:hypothetical protein
MENDLLQPALDNLRKRSSLLVNLRKATPLDGTLEIQLGNQLVELVAWVKNEVRPQQYSEIAEKFHTQKNLIIVANKIYPKVKEFLRAEGIAYMEVVGNIFINQQGIYVWIENEKAQPIRNDGGNKAFTKSGLRVVYQFLAYPKSLNEPYRTIADKAGVALGNIPGILSNLKDAGFLVKKDKKIFVITRKKELLTKWVDAYAMKLKPSLKVGEFGIKNGKDWSSINLNADDSVWGSECAGEFYTNYLRPEHATIYSRLSTPQLIQKYGLIPQKNGPIEVFKMFWEGLPSENNPLNKKLPYVTPTLTYADLVQIGDKRCFDTAQMLYDEHIQPKL